MDQVKSKLFLITPMLLFSLFSCNRNEEYVPEPYRFNTDTWDVIRKLSDKGGLDLLKATYHPSNNTFIIKDLNNENEIKEKTKSIYLQGYGEIKMRVIGENHDIDTNGRVCPLTFEAQAILPKFAYSSLERSNNAWVGSNVRDYLQNVLPCLIQDKSKTAARNVLKRTYEGNGEGKNIITTQEKFFILSCSEIDPSGTSHGFTYLDEGETYEYYKDADPQVVRKKPRITESPDSHGTYWLRSPIYSSILNAATIEYEDNNNIVLWNDVACCDNYGLVVAFAI